MKNKTITILIVIFTLIGFTTIAQVGFQWSKGMGSTSNDAGQSIVADALGNVYTIGNFNGVVDFDPGVGVYDLTAVGLEDVFVSKLDATGAFVWAKNFGGSGSDYGMSLAVDASGNVFTAGYFSLIGDFDPSAAIYNLTSAGSTDIFVSKLDASGNFVWAIDMGGTGAEVAHSMTLDASGNVLTTGFFKGTADFDPGVAVYNLVPVGINDIFVSKLDALGNFVWAKGFGGSASDVGWAITSDASGNVYTTGSFDNIVDFDPGVAVYNLTTMGFNDIFVSKLDALGSFVWAKQLGGSSPDIGLSITVDATGNVYTTGYFAGTGDYDPDAGTYSLLLSGFEDIFVSKLNSSGAFVWAKSMGGAGGVHHGNSVAVDGTGNVYTTGRYSNTVDFDPGVGVYNITAAGGWDVFVSKLDALGDFVWAKSMGSSGSVGNDYGNSVFVDAANNVYTTGFYSAIADFDPSPIVYNLTSLGLQDAFVHKMSPCTAPATPTILATGSTTFCQGGNVMLTSSVENAYLWSNGATTQTVVISVSGNYFVNVSNVAGCVSTSSLLSVTVNPSPTITVNSGAVCSGQSFTIIPSGANTYTISGGSSIVSPTVNASYSVTGTSSLGCVSPVTAVSNITVNILPTIAVNSGSICSGKSFTIIPSGATTYTFSNGNAIVSPTISNSYSVTGTSAVGCVGSNTAVSNVTVNPNPTLTATSNSSLLCIGQSATLTVSGANTYSWSNGVTNVTNVISPTVNTSYTVNGTSANGCSNIAVVSQSVSSCNGFVTQSVVEASEISFYPNPTHGILNVVSAGSNSDIINIRIINILGELLTSLDLNSKQKTINIEHLTSGIYFIIIKQNSLIKTVKIIKE